MKRSDLDGPAAVVAPTLLGSLPALHARRGVVSVELGLRVTTLSVSWCVLIGVNKNRGRDRRGS